MIDHHYSIDTGVQDDAATIASFQVAMAQETEDCSLDPETVRAGVDSMFRHPERGFYVVGRGNDGSAVSSLLVLKEWSDWRNTDVWWIHSLYVMPEHRRRGLFRRMYAFVEERARGEGAAGLRLYVERANHSAKAVYTALGLSNKHYEMFEKMF